MVDRRQAEGGRLKTVKTSNWFELIGSHISDPDVSSAIVLVPPQNAGTLMIQTNAQNLRYTLDGTVPTTTTGFVLTAGAEPKEIPLRPTVTVTIIEAAATANVEIQYGE
jgi:hypothetical protein